jgi:hypothetical protein
MRKCFNENGGPLSTVVHGQGEQAAGYRACRQQRSFEGIDEVALCWTTLYKTVGRGAENWSRK